MHGPRLVIVRVRLLRHEVIEPGGARKKTLRVFCPVQACSIPQTRCKGCPRLRGAFVDEGGCGDLLCEVDEAEATEAAERGGVETATVAQLAAGVTVGQAMSDRVVGVDQHTSVRLAQQAAAAERAFAMPVVSEAGELLGVVQRRDLASIPPVNLPLSAAGLVDTAAAALHESAPLSTAISAMTAERARWLPVVDASGALAGAITDLDLLRWMVRARGAL